MFTPLCPGGGHLPLHRRGPAATSGRHPSGGAHADGHGFGQEQDSLSFIVFLVHGHRGVALGGRAACGLRAASSTCAGRRRPAEHRVGDGDATSLALEDVEVGSPRRPTAHCGRESRAPSWGPRLPGWTLGRGQEPAHPRHRPESGRSAGRDPRAARCPPPGSPQKAYLPIGSLRYVVSYPRPAGGVDDATLRERSRRWGCPGWPVDSTRTALGAAIVAWRAAAHRFRTGTRPGADWLFLDEATSAWTRRPKRASTASCGERLPAPPCLAVGPPRNASSPPRRELVVRPRRRTRLHRGGNRRPRPAERLMGSRPCL